MKTLVFLFCPINDYSVCGLSGGAGAIERSVAAAQHFPGVASVIVCVPSIPDGITLPSGCTVVCCPEWTKKALLDTAAIHSEGFDHVFFAPADAPFLSVAAAQRLAEQHITYAAEYTFADGYPAGLFPEIAARGILPMLSSIAAGTEERVSRDTVFSILQKDINSFDIETDIAPVDMRPLRLEFLCDSKRNTEICRRFLTAGCALTPDTVADDVAHHLSFVRTFPSFYYIQTTADCPHHCSICPYPSSAAAKTARSMDANDFSVLVKKAIDFSGDAVISPSLWGEPALNDALPKMIHDVLSYPSASLLIETTGIGWKPDVLAHIADDVKNAVPRTNGKNPIEWIVSIDGIDDEYYRAVHSGGDAANVISFVTELSALFPGCVWPQMVRTLDNEPHLESFYRFWKEKTNNVIIQKYDHFCGNLPQKKTADLSPVARNVCWHLKRDMVILSDGSVPVCRECLDGTGTCGNALTDSFADIWAVNKSLYDTQCTGGYPGLCGTCDEYYTFNF